MFKHFLVTISFLFFINFHAHAENIAIVDVNFLINNSKAGKFIQKNLTADNKKIVEELKKKETNLINEEKKLITQKNVLSEEELVFNVSPDIPNPGENNKSSNCSYSVEKDTAFKLLLYPEFFNLSVSVLSSDVVTERSV